jgi:hypothetical protein
LITYNEKAKPIKRFKSLAAVSIGTFSWPGLKGRIRIQTKSFWIPNTGSKFSLVAKNMFNAEEEGTCHIKSIRLL